ncbi:MAG TPA: ABC transporter permease [Acidimicrobiales bacterium]|jgi:phospholipid/cholesterol/gamma-HCH transport system permease protein
MTGSVEERLAGLGRFAMFAGKVLTHAAVDVIGRLRFWRVVVRHTSDIVAGAGAVVVGGGMVFVVAAMALAVGATVGVQAIAGLSQVGAESYVGIVGALANTREITPLIAGVALSAQVGASFTAEIGSMRISEEIDALEVMSIPSLVYLVSTRIVALVAALVPLYLVAMFASFWGTRFVTTQLFGASPGLYDYYFRLYLPTIDVVYSAIKVAIFAVEVGLIHGYFGYFATGGPAGVGRAVGVAIRITIVVVVSTNLLLSYVFWGTTTTVSLTG